jgi:hypothetical protein
MYEALDFLPPPAEESKRNGSEKLKIKEMQKSHLNLEKGLTRRAKALKGS